VNYCMLISLRSWNLGSRINVTSPIDPIVASLVLGLKRCLFGRTAIQKSADLTK